MPELPEVETIRRQLNAALKRRTIAQVDIRLAKTIKTPVRSFTRNVRGATITEVRRRAKLLVFVLQNGWSILVHLKMTGQLIYRKGSKMAVGGHPIRGGTTDLPNRYTHIILSFTDGGRLFFNDLRRFGYWKLVRTDGLLSLFRTMPYGPEPLADDFTLPLFRDLLARKKKARIKPLLMDQAFVAGVGNIYAAEMCFAAGIRPTRTVGSLTPKETSRLFRALKKILSTAVAKQGTSADRYVDAYGQPGAYVPLLKVYGRQGQPCLRCGTVIKAISLAGRGTTFCPHCQT